MNNVSNILQRLARLNPEIAAQQDADRSNRELASILAGSSIPAYARPGGAEPDPNMRQAQLQQLAALGTPEATSILAQLSPLMQKPASPMSTVGKIQADISQGLIAPDVGQKAIEAAVASKAPVVNVNSGINESAFQKKFGEERAKAIDTLITEQRNKSEQALRSLPALDRIETLLNEGLTTGGLDDTKIALGNVIRGIGGDPSRVEALKNVNQLEEVRSLTNNLVIPLAKQLGYNPTDADAKRIESSVAGLGKGPEANRALIGFLRDAASNAKQVQDYIDEALLRDDPKEIRNLDTRVNKLKSNLLQDSLNKLSRIEITKSAPKKAVEPEKVIILDENFNIVE